MSYRRVGLALLLAAVLGAGLIPTQARADSQARIVRLSYVDGDVQIDPRDGRGFEHAFLNMPLTPGTRLSTGADGRAEIEFEDGSTVRLTPGTLVETQSLTLRSSGGKYTLVDLQEGTAYFDIRRLKEGDDFRVTAGRREFSLNRASHFRILADRSQVVLSVFKGEVEVIGEGGRLTVRKQETLTLDLNDPSRYFLARGVSRDRYDDWDHDREQFRERYANAGNYSGYSTAYSYGVADLNYWGSYRYIPGYGRMWRPHFYDASWSPFSDGGWYYYPGYGWIWVSAYPWGWMPYRYGNWYYISGHGWCWRPGRRWHSWSPAFVAHNAPRGYRLPVAPPRTGRRAPVVVGGGPTTILPPQDPGPEHLIGNRDLLGRRRGSAVGGGSGAVVTPAPGPGGHPSGGPGISVVSGGGSGAPATSGGSNSGGQPVVRPGRLPAPPEREVDLEDAIRNARERRAVGGGTSGGVITNSGSGGANSQGGSVSVSGGGSSGVAVQPAPSPSSGRERIPEPRRMLPSPSDSPSVASPSASGSSGGSSIGAGSGNGSGSGSGATSAPAQPAPSPGVGRTPQPRRVPAPESFTQSPGPSRSYSGAGAGSSGGYSAPSSPPPSSSGGRARPAPSSPSPRSSVGGASGSGYAASSRTSAGGSPSSAGSAGASRGAGSGHTSRPSSPKSPPPK